MSDHLIILNKSELSDMITNAVGNAMANFKPVIHQEKEKKYLKREEVCDILHVTSVTLWKYTKSGKIQASKIGGRVLYESEAVEQAVQARNFKPKH